MWFIIWTSLVGLGLIAALAVPRILRHRKAFLAKLAIHRQRTRKIYGCFHCGRELFGDSYRHVCGTCVEDTAFCDRCYAKQRHPHQMYREPIDWEVDPSALTKAPCVAEAFLLAFSIYANRWCIGWRDELNGRLADDYTWLTYKSVVDQATLIGRSLGTLGVAHRGKVVVIGVASRDWYLVNYALFMRQYVCVPLHASASIASVAHVIRLAKPDALIVSSHVMTSVERAREQSGVAVPLIVTLQDPVEAYAMRTDDHPPSSSNDVDNTNLLPSPHIMTLHQVMQRGEVAADDGFKPIVGDGTEIVMLLPTSGTSGLPKLTIITDEMLIKQARPPEFGVPTVMFSFEPLRQSLDVLAKGGRIGVYSGSLARLHDDMRLLRPTVFGATPVLWAGLHQSYVAALNEALQSAQTKADREAVEAAVTAQWKAKRLLGNRCRLAIIGGAGSSQALRHWIFTMLNCVIVDGYGTTETGGLAGSGDVKEGTNLQLIDCPELGYRTSDLPWPRGEIVARTQRMTPGYFGDPEATAERFVTVGGLSFFRTGDIGEMVNGKLKVIDRRNAVFKLAQGVFVAPAPLEELYATCNLLSSVFVFGDSSMNAVAVAVVLTPQTPLKDAAAEQTVLAALRDIGRAAQKAAWEIPGQVIIDDTPWTPENGLLSSIGKLCRPALRARFMPRVVVVVVTTSASTLVSSPPPSSASPIDAEIPHSDLSIGLCRVLLASIPSLKPSLLLPSTRLVDLGADSLAFARLAAQLKERFGTQLPLPQLVRLPTLLHLQFAVFAGGMGVAALLKELEATDAPIDWSTEAARACSDLEKNFIIAERAPTNPDAILLTGSTGFFGAFLLAALLVEPAHASKRIVCVARAANDEEAMQRVTSNLKLYGLWSSTDASRIEARAGDVSKASLGLNSATYENLKSRVACIVHNAAVVTSALPYASIRPANVEGTEHVIRLAAASCAPLHHISTIGLLAGSGVMDERAQVPSIALSMLSSYAQSKWVAERLVLRARQLGLRVRMYRAGTLAAHSVTGACNAQDTVTRLLLGLRAERVCCLADDTPLPQSFPLIASDWAAAAVTKLTATPLPLPSTEAEDEAVMHVVSRTPQSLADLVAAIETATGAPLARVSSAEFRERMAALGESHALFPFKTSLSGRGYASAAAGVLPDDKRLSLRLQGLMPPACPLFDLPMLVRMIQWAVKHEGDTKKTA